MGQDVTFDRHPLVRAVDDVVAAVDEVPDANPAFLRAEEKEHVLTTLSREVARLQALQLRVLAAAGDVAEERGERSAGAWLAHTPNGDIRFHRRE